MQVLWESGGTDWLPLRMAKENYLVQVAEYVVANKIDSEPAFSLWMKYTLRKTLRRTSTSLPEKQHIIYLLLT